MHMLMSALLLFTFLISHYVENVQFSSVSDEGRVEWSWARHQVNVSVDFHADETWAAWLFGGFNTHVAHHLFPNLSHVHYRHITRLIRSKLKAHGIPYRSVTFIGGVVSHVKLLKQLGRNRDNHIYK